MSYTKHEWVTGNVVGAVDLNRIENGIANIDVDEIRGWGMQNTQLFSESVTTATAEGQPAPMGTLTYAEFITTSSLTVSFDGTDYTVPMIDNSPAHIYGEIVNGGPSFANYPFCIVSMDGDGNMVFTETAGTYTITATAPLVEVGNTFRRAVLNALGSGTFPLLCVSGVTTHDEIESAYTNKRILYFYTSEDECFFITNPHTTPLSITPSSAFVTASYTDGNIFIITES